MNRLLRPNLILAVTATLLAGCDSSHAPTIDILGSYFPAWIICVVIGLALTVVTRLVLFRARLNAHLRPAPVVYVSLTLGFTLLVWLIFFQN